MTTYRLHVEHEFVSQDVRLHILRRGRGEPDTVAAKVEFAAVGPGAHTPDAGRVLPFGESQRDFLQAIMDGAWEAGFRPSGYGDVREATAALRFHLEDMRALAFHATGIGKPEVSRG